MIDFGPINRAMVDAGYAGDIEVEIFNDRLWKLDDNELATRCRDAFLRGGF